MGLRIVIILLLLTLPACASSWWHKPLDVRPITLKVVDARTRQPLPGISVHYGLQTIVFQKYVLLFIPSLEPDRGPKVAYKAHKYTDTNGEVTFHVQGYALPGNEQLDEEFLFINVDVDMAHPSARISQESLADYYRNTSVKRSGPVDNVDVMWDLIAEKQARIEVYCNPSPEYEGVMLFTRVLYEETDMNPGSRKKSGTSYEAKEEGEKLRMGVIHADLQETAPVTVVVPLEPYRADAQ